MDEGGQAWLDQGSSISGTACSSVGIIDNVSTRLGDDLRRELRPGSRLRIAASTFSIFAFEALRDELMQLEEMEFIFTDPSFIAEQATDKVRKQRREFFIPGGGAERSLAGTEFEIRLRNKLTQRAIARECAEWVRRKVRFRSNANGKQMQQFAVVDDRVAYAPLQGFSTTDLGYERGSAVSSFVQRSDEASTTTQYLKLFDQIWNDPWQVEEGSVKWWKQRGVVGRLRVG